MANQGDRKKSTTVPEPLVAPDFRPLPVKQPVPVPVRTV